MKKKIILISVIILFIIAAFTMWYFYLRNEAILENRLQENIANGSEINIQELTPFDWDKFYVFAPYSTNGHISDVLGIKTSLEGSLYDERQLLVFTKNNTVVSAIYFPRYSPGADFLPENIFSKNDAIFTLDNNKLHKK